MANALPVSLIPTSPTSFSFRPLSTGMVTSETTMAMPNGSFLEVNGYDMTTRGPKKHGAWRPDLINLSTGLPIQLVSADPTERIEALTQLTLADGTTSELAVTNRALYTVDEVFGYTRLNWMQPYDVTSISQGAIYTTIVTTGDFNEHYLDTSDRIIFDNIEYPISSLIVTATEMTLAFAALPSITGVTEYQIYKPFMANDAQFIDFATARFKMFFVDGTTRMIWSYDGVLNADGNYYVQPHIIKGNADERTVMGARSITFFNERLYFGGILEDEVDDQSNHTYTTHMNRIRWTEVLNHASCFAGSYQDLTRTTGSVTKVSGMGSLIMAYMTDGIYYGRNTNLTSIPYMFSFIETAGVTALGMKAVSPYFDGQVFLGVDNLYFVTADAQITALGQNVSDTLKEHTQVPHMSVVTIDAERSRILVGTSNLDNVCDTMFFFNYNSKGWSINTSLQFVAPLFMTNNVYLYYSMIPAADEYATSSLAFKTFKSLDQHGIGKKFYCFMNGYFMCYEDEQALNQLLIGGVVTETDNPATLITPDFDFNDPDANKTALRVSLKITETDRAARTESIYFNVHGSRDRGLTWKHLGRMRIKPNLDEDALNFRLMGSTLRFRFTTGSTVEGTSTNVLPYTISEVILSIRENSVEAQRDNSRT